MSSKWQNMRHIYISISIQLLFHLYNKYVKFVILSRTISLPTQNGKKSLRNIVFNVIVVNIVKRTKEYV